MERLNNARAAVARGRLKTVLTGEIMELFLYGFIVVLFVLSLLNSRCAYLNGVCDGYGYSKEPSCPGYWAAGEHLKKTMYHRWPELKGKP